MINKFTGGDMSLIPKLMEFNENKDSWNDEMATKQKFVDDFIGQAIEAYFKKENITIPEMEGEYGN
jgi:MerR family transcriptional regulator, thiopeptide resistance regulator